jgi:pyruvate dehydrogenase E1 component alpha subunit
LPTSSKTTHKELTDFFEMMTAMRHMEVQCNKLYMDRLIRGFLHVYVGEESVAVGIESAITKEDCVITGYRDHGIAMARGDSPYEILAENIGKRTGSTKGKGGSMHLYSRKNNFYGGHGIVGAQVNS